MKYKITSREITISSQWGWDKSEIGFQVRLEAEIEGDRRLTVDKLISKESLDEYVSALSHADYLDCHEKEAEEVFAIPRCRCITINGLEIDREEIVFEKIDL